jgi:hypothetical protein
VFTDDGLLVVGKVEGRGFRELERYRLGSSTGWSHPAVLGTRIVYRDGNDLAVVLLDQPRPSPPNE